MVNRRLARQGALVLLAALLTGACSGPRVFSNYDPQAHFEAFHTYGWQAHAGEDEGGEPTPLLTTYLRRAVAQQLEMRGYTEADDPDLLVNFNVATEEKVQAHTMPTGGYYGYRRGYYEPWGSGYETHVEQYTEGTLNIDLVDAAAGRLVWEAAVVGRITNAVRDDLQDAVDRAVAEAFAKYPFVAGSDERRPRPGS